MKAERQTQHKQNHESEYRNMIALTENTSENGEAEKDQPTQQPQH